MGKSAPKTPDPYAVAKSQTDSNVATAREQAKIGMTGQTTPWGSLNYVTDPNSPSGYRAVQSLSPEEEALLRQGQELQGQYGEAAQGALGRVTDTMGTPFDMSAARATELTDIQRTLMDPQWNAREEALKTSLMNRGIREGDEQWANIMRDFSSGRDDAYNRMYLSGYDTANKAALTERNIPMSDLASLGVGAFPGQDQSMGFASTPTPGVAPTDVTGSVYNSHKIESDRANAGMGGLFGLGSSVLGGWARAGFPGLSLSDRRVKTNIERIGDDPRGWGVYRFSYLWDGVRKAGQHLGFMADEVERVRPEAVVRHPTGLKMVDYDALALV